MEKTKDSRRWLLLLLMLAAFAVTFMTRFVWSPLNTTVTEELGLSNVAAGSFMSAFFIGYVITQIPGEHWQTVLGSSMFCRQVCL